MLTTFALKVAEPRSRALTGFSVPTARLLIETPESTSSISGGMRTDQILLSTHSLVTTMRDVKPKSMLEVNRRLLMNSKETLVSKDIR